MSYVKIFSTGEIAVMDDNMPLRIEKTNKGNGNEVAIAAKVLADMAKSSACFTVAKEYEQLPPIVNKAVWRTVKQSYQNGGDNSKPPEVYVTDAGLIKIISDGDIDADGSPRAKIIDPGNGQTQTSLGRDNGWKGEGQYVNSEDVAYFVLPENFPRLGAGDPSLGCIARISLGEKCVYAILADKGPKTLIGEISIKAAESLGFNPWSNGIITHGIPMGLVYDILPKAIDLGRCLDNASIQQYGAEQFHLAQFPEMTKKPKPATDIPSVIPFATQLSTRMATKGKYPEGMRGAVVHFTAGKSGLGIIDYARQMGYAFLFIDRDGKLYQAHNILEWGSHAGNSSHPKLNGGVTDDLIGIETCCAGRLREVVATGTTTPTGMYAPWFALKDGAPEGEGRIEEKWCKSNELIPQSECRYEPTNDSDSVQGWYHKFTPEQEATLIKTLGWLRDNIPTFDTDLILSHFEVARPVGRKNDVSGALGMSMDQLRAAVKALP